LGFVNAKGDGLARRKVEVGGEKALFVKPVAGFVHDAEERRREVVIFVASGQADVGRSEGGAEGVGGGVDSTLGKVEAERFSYFAV
jgi:hypothetical protein